MYCLERDQFFCDLKAAIAARLRAERTVHKRIWLQSMLPKYALAIIAAAWECGWTIVIVRDDDTENRIEAINKQLQGDYLKFVYSVQVGHVIVTYHSTSCVFENWLNEKTEIGGDCYRWGRAEAALILFTSGSTGAPKGVCHSYHGMKMSAQVFVDHYNIQKSDTFCSTAPLHTTTGIRSMILPLFHPIKVLFLPKSPDERFLTWLDKIISIKPTLLFLGPTIINLIANYDNKLIGYFHGIKAFLSGGSEINELSRAKIQQLHGIPVLNIYGSTEAGGAVLAEKWNEQCFNALPLPCHGVRLCLNLIDQKEQLFQLSYESPHLYIGYVGEVLSEKKRFISDDIVKKLTNGQLKWMGRTSAIFKGTNQEWVFPKQLEQILKKNHNIRDVVVEYKASSDENPLIVWIDVLQVSAHFLEEYRAHIIRELGIEYGKSQWYFAEIMRTPQGKLDYIVPYVVDEKREPQQT